MILDEILGMPIGYDMGIDIKTIRKRKKRKGCINKPRDVETIVFTSKEVADISAEALTTLFKRIM